jgi:hypothetical protein
MKRFLWLSALVLAVMQASAADVDLAAAQAAARNFVQRHATGTRYSGKPAGDVRLLHAEANSSRNDAYAYYIFNTDNSFVIVAGDDRAQEILAHGDRPLDIDRMPDNMKFWLTTYKRQIEFLQEHPDVIVEQPRKNVNRRATVVAPLLTAEWDQLDPYWNKCPIYNGEYCLTGCPATSLSMVFYYWKYPTQPTPEVSAYLSPSCFMHLDALPSVTFDWDNMLDIYEGVDYTAEQADAVATLMRYVGQAEKMDYTPDGSGAQGDDILRAVKFFGYDDETAELVTKSVADYYGHETELINDADWSEMLLNELAEGRPVVYCAFDYDNNDGWSGHAFNVDGYNLNDNTYHVNWGWSGIGNGDFALNAFSYRDYTFNIEQQMIMGIQPPITTPTILTVPHELNMKAFAEQEATATFNVRGKFLVDDVTLTLDDAEGVFSLDAASVALSQTEEGQEITVTYAPQTVGNHTAVVTLSSPEADDVTVTLSGVATLETYDPVMLPADSAYINLTQFRAEWTDLTADKYVTGYTLEVNTKPGVTLLEDLDWSTVQENSTNYANTPSELLPEGWTFNGNGLWCEAGGISISNKSSFTSPDYELVGYEKVTAVVTAKSVTNSSSAKFMVSTGIDSLLFTAPGGTPYTQYVAVLDCNELDHLKFSGKGNYTQFQEIMVYAGELEEEQLRDIHEEGGTDYRLITGITAKNFTVTGLEPGGMFYYRVKAFYTDGTHSAWSKSRSVTLFENGASHEPGDVNHDGKVNISDVTLLISYLLSGQGDIDQTAADLNGDTLVNITDVTQLISFLTTQP